MSPTFSLRNNALGYHHARLEGQRQRARGYRGEKDECEVKQR